MVLKQDALHNGGIGFAFRFHECTAAWFSSASPTTINPASPQVARTVDRVFKVKEGRPNIVDLIKGEKIQIIINTSQGADPWFDEKAIRRASILHRIPAIADFRHQIAASYISAGCSCDSSAWIDKTLLPKHCAGIRVQRIKTVMLRGNIEDVSVPPAMFCTFGK